MKLIIIVAALLLAAACADASEQVVWQIGTPDRNYREFAIAGNYKAFQGQFGAKPPVFVVGKSDPARDWPYIQPGPLDNWARNIKHPFTVRFDLADKPQGVFTLRVEFVNVNAHPVTFEIAIGSRSGRFHLDPGSVAGALTDPARGKPQKIEVALPANLFRAGDNKIVFTCAEGASVLYDAVTLLNDKEGRMPQSEIQSVTATPTALFVRRDGQVRRVVNVSVAMSAPPRDLTLRAETGGQTFETPIKQLPRFGSAIEEIAVPDSPQALEVKVTALAAGQAKSVTVTVPPQRKWLIYCGASAHTDVGYTGLQPKVAEHHNANTDLAGDFIQKFPDFRWNCEVAWQAENYLAARTGERRDTFLRLAREGKIGVQALYAHMLTGLCSHEAMCRLTAYAYSLKTRYGIPYKSAMISDVPTQEWSLPMILANSGICYFSSGINNGRAGTFTPLEDKTPSWWEGPDGSRVLMVWTRGYGQGARYGLTRGLDEVRSLVPSKLQSYENRTDYPFDAIWLHGIAGDNGPLPTKLAEVVKTWNDRYEFPKIILSHNAEFFEHIEKNYGDKLPVFRGSGGTYWEDGAGSSAAETKLCRNAQESLANASTWLALAHGILPETAYPAADIASAWRNCFLYDEHTWGANCSVREPDSDFTKAQWKIKAQFALDADREAKSLLARGASALAGCVRSDGPALVVLNPTSWPRTDIVEVPGAASAKPLLVKDVPACGYRVIKLDEAAKQAAVPQPAKGEVIESKFYRVQFDPATGTIVSVFDKQLQRELVDAKAAYRLNQYLYVAGGKDSRIVGGGKQPQLTISKPQQATLRRERLGDLGERMTIETAAPMTPRLVQEVTVWNDLKRVDIANRLTKTLTYEKEGVYFAFPFAAEVPTFRYECPAGIVNTKTDMLPGACLDWFTVQHFVEIADRDIAITWSTPDAPLVCFQDINRGLWQTKLDLKTGHLYAYVMNNYWFTNYKAGQEGEFTFRFSFTSQRQADNVASARFGWAASNPLLAQRIDGGATGAFSAPADSLVEVAEPNIILVSAKQAEDRDALVLRFWEVSGRSTTAHVRLKHRPINKATACSLVEEPQKPLAINDATIAVPIRGAGLATVIIE